MRCDFLRHDEATVICRRCGLPLSSRLADLLQIRRECPDSIGKARQPCAFLGAQIGLQECETCGGNVRLKLFACSHPAHDETTFQQCEACPDYATAAPAAPP